ncbi:MAG: hypothetical protein A4E62_02493 [Syntrophorhabdus sp. PtaU1.Bin002]|nr:MAG: hypothetical protein A4E62_02493 [Syntrophorhabdus sp. PtaU1.Bin002]
MKYCRDDRFFFLKLCLFLDNGCKNKGFTHVKIEVIHPFLYIFFCEIFEGFSHNRLNKVIDTGFPAIVIGIRSQITLDGVCVDTKPLEENRVSCKTKKFVTAHDARFLRHFCYVVEIVAFQDLEGVYVPLPPAHLRHNLND